MIDFARNLAFELHRQKKTQQQLSRETHLTQAAISHYMSGSRVPRADTLLILADALNISVDELLRPRKGEQ